MRESLAKTIDNNSEGMMHGCHLAFSKGQIIQIRLFKKNFPEIKWFGHLAIFGLFLMLKKILYFKACFGEIWENLTIFYDIITLTLVILTIFLKKNLLSLGFVGPFKNFYGFGLFWNCLWPNLAFKFFFGPDNPGMTRFRGESEGGRESGLVMEY